MHRRAFMAAIGLSPLGILPAAASTDPKKKSNVAALSVRIDMGQFRADIDAVIKESWATIEQEIAQRVKRLEHGIEKRQFRRLRPTV